MPSVKIKDGEFFGDMGRIGAEGDWLLHEQRTSLSKTEWDKRRLGMICTSSTVFSNIHGVIRKFCGETKACTYEIQQMTEALSAKIQTISDNAGVNKIYSIPLFGDVSADIIIFQNALRNAGYDPGPIDGVFGDKLNAAVVQFQVKNNLPGTGLVDLNLLQMLGLNVQAHDTVK